MFSRIADVDRLPTRIVEPAREFVWLFAPLLLVGIGAGLGAVAFRKLISLFTWLFYTAYPRWTAFAHPVNLVFAPVIGALWFGPMIWRWAREARGHGVPEVMEAVALRGGRIRPVVAVVKSLASSIDIGSGGAVGREGPIAQIGSAFGSTLGQALHLPPRLMRLVVTAGAAAGISATFNAPIAGALFGLEVILRDFTPLAFASVGIAAVVADMVAIPFLGTRPFFNLPPGVGLRSPWELLIFAALGLLSAAVGTAFSSGLYWLEDRFSALRLHEALRPALGAVLLGVLITALPPVRGLGYGVMALAFDQKLALGTLALYLGGKFLASGLTLGSGGSGGIFTPTLYMGTMLGGVVALLAGHLAPAAVGSPAGYMLVGAAAVFAAASRAPITAVLIVMEMSQNYVLAVPLMVATLVAARASAFLMTDSIYTLKLSRRGVRILQDTAVDVLGQVPVADAMDGGVTALAPELPVSEAVRAMAAERRQALPVVDRGRLVGIVTVADLERGSEAGQGARTVGEITVRDLLVAYPQDSLREAVRRMSQAGVGQLLVVEPERPDRLLGVLRRVDVLRAMETKVGALGPDAPGPPSLPGDGAVTEVRLPRSSPHAHRRLRDLRVPPGVLVVSIHRGGVTIVARGDTLLMPEDRVALYVHPARLAKAAARFLLTGDRDPEWSLPDAPSRGAATGEEGN
jgi:CIC family chloride channel protein